MNCSGCFLVSLLNLFLLKPEMTRNKSSIKLPSLKTLQQVWLLGMTMVSSADVDVQVVLMTKQLIIFTVVRS